MSENPLTALPETSIVNAAQEMIANGIGCLPVVKEGKLVGIFTETDLVAYFATTDSRVQVKTIMTDSFLTCHRHHSINHVLRGMETNHVFWTIVQEGNGVPVSIITHTNLAFAKEPFVSSKDVVMVRKVEHAGVQKKSICAKVFEVAEDIMSEPLITIASDSRAVAAARLMVAKRIDAIPVIREESVVGVISKTDIVKRMVE